MQEDRDEGGWGMSGRKKKLNASLVPPDQAIPEVERGSPVGIGVMNSSAVPMITTIGEKEEPVAV